MHPHPCGTHIAPPFNMTIRIDVNTEEAEVVVYLAGRLTGDTAKQLKDTCDSIKGAFVLDLSKLIFADDAGIEAMRAISEQGIQNRGASQFIQLLANNLFDQKGDMS